MPARAGGAMVGAAGRVIGAAERDGGVALGAPPESRRRTASETIATLLDANSR